MTWRAPRVRGPALAAAGLLAIAAATLTSTAPTYEPVSGACLLCAADSGADAVANLLLFVPFGAGLVLSGVRVRRALLLVTLTTLAVELLQLRVVAGRDASVDDLLANVAGGALGVAAVRRWRALVYPAPRLAAGLAALGTVGAVAVATATAWMLAPALRPGPWSVHLPNADAGSPVVLGARLGELRLADTTLDATEPLRRRLLDGAALSALVAVPRDVRGEPGILVFEHEDTEQALVDFRRAGRDVAFYVRTRTAAFRLRMPPVALRDFLPAAAPATPGARDTVRLTGTIGRGRLGFTAERRGLRQARWVAPSPHWGWSFLLPGSYGYGAEARLLTALWAAGLAVPAAYWSARATAGARGARRLVALLPLLPAVALLLLPPAFGLLPAHGSEWAGWAGGVGVGFGLGVRSRRAGSPGRGR